MKISLSPAPNFLVKTHILCHKDVIKVWKEKGESHSADAFYFWRVPLRKPAPLAGCLQWQRNYDITSLSVNLNSTDMISTPATPSESTFNIPSAFQSGHVPTYIRPLYYHNTCLSFYTVNSDNGHHDQFLRHSQYWLLLFPVKTLPLPSDSGILWAGWGERAPRPPTSRHGLCCPSYARWQC